MEQVAAVPVVQDVDDAGRTPNVGEVRVTSPTGTVTIVPEDRTAALESQGYQVG